jgi:hypothetical protein
MLRYCWNLSLNKVSVITGIVAGHIRSRLNRTKTFGCCFQESTFHFHYEDLRLFKTLSVYCSKCFRSCSELQCSWYNKNITAMETRDIIYPILCFSCGDKATLSIYDFHCRIFNLFYGNGNITCDSSICFFHRLQAKEQAVLSAGT